jgi:uncharacterized protein involved in exopolysaccharide biosynthesis
MAPVATPSISDYLIMARRRLKPMLVTAITVFCLAVLAAVLWPPTYRSSATILIEEQEIPEDMVRSTITSYADQQIQVIRQRVMTLDNIMKLADKFALYTPEERAQMPRTAIAAEFDKAVTLNVISADITDRRSGRQQQATVAFSLSYDSHDPKKAQQVTNELVNLYLNENLRTRAEKTRSTESFLREEAAALNQQLTNIEDKLARFKQENKDALPESFQFNVQNLRSLESQLQGLQANSRELRTREMELRAQLAQTNPYAPIVLSTGQTVLADVDRLKALQAEYRNKAALYNANHPDIKRLRKEIDTLSAKVGHAGDQEELRRLLMDRQTELAQLQSQYSPGHPDLVAKQRLVEQLEAQLAMSESGGSQATPDNPTYVYLTNQLSTLRMERTSLDREAQNLMKEIELLNQAVYKAPAVEKEYAQLQRDLQITQAKYLELNATLREAELAGALEKDRKGQRFTLLEPPELPVVPVRPNRLALLLVGTMLAGAAGLAIMILLEALDDSLRSVKDLTAATGTAPLATITYIKTPKERSRDRPARRILIIGIAFVVLMALALAAAVFLLDLNLRTLW